MRFSRIKSKTEEKKIDVGGNEMRSFEMEVGGRPLVIENGKMAKQANGAVLVDNFPS